MRDDLKEVREQIVLWSERRAFQPEHCKRIGPEAGGSGACEEMVASITATSVEGENEQEVSQRDDREPE